MPRVTISSRNSDRISTDVEIAQLQDLDVGELRQHWRAVFRRPPPSHLSRNLILRILSYRLQAKRFGDIDQVSRDLLDRAAASQHQEKRDDKLAIQSKSLKVGTTLVREWNGRRYRVTVVSEGFVWNDKTYRSLSEVALHVTGTRWNGPRFFGLRDR